MPPARLREAGTLPRPGPNGASRDAADPAGPPGPTSLARALWPRPPLLTALASLVRPDSAHLEFRRVLQEIFPAAAAELLATPPGPGETRESARCEAFLRKVGAELFPCYEADEYDQLVWSVPFVREGWSYDRVHEVDLPVGELLLFALCEQPYLADDGVRIALLDAAAAHLPEELVVEIPADGLHPAALHEALDGTPFGAAAAYADWLWGVTESVFLDVDPETEVEVAWSRENAEELASQWRHARALLDRITALEQWLEADPLARFARLLDAALGRDSHLLYERERKLYACELTPDGLLTRTLADPGAGPAAPAGGAPERAARVDPGDPAEPDPREPRPGATRDRDTGRIAGGLALPAGPPR